MKIKFRDIRLSPENKSRLVTINKIVEEYRRQGLVLTLRQLYYQLVSRDVIPNQQKEYARLSKLLKEGRMAGLVHWDAIEDRLREVSQPASFDGPAAIMRAAIKQYEVPRLDGQENYLEVWVEKDALSGVLSRVTEPYHVPIMVNRGYSSVSAIYDAYGRFWQALARGQRVVILYLGDFDPSGVDMIRDVRDRPLEMLLPVADNYMGKAYDALSADEVEQLREDFEGDQDCWEGEEGDLWFSPQKALVKKRFKVVPIALTREQINRYKPPPNPAKTTDPRSGDFIAAHGTQSWEVDALRPEVLNQILTAAIESRLDLDKYRQQLAREDQDKARLEELIRQLPDYEEQEEDDAE